jgi:hypothetical protein
VCPHASFNGYDDVWDKVGQAVGNFQSLMCIQMCSNDEYDSDEDEDSPILDWDMLARILRHIRQSVKVAINDFHLRTIEEVQPFARAIRGNPTITSFVDRGMFPYESLDTFYSALATLPALESVWFGCIRIVVV